MKRVLAGVVFAFALSGLSSPAAAFPCFFFCGAPPGGGGSTHDAPAPLIGVGLPGLAIGVGYGAYWLSRRRRKA
jgi:hypothetical protein